MTIINHSFSCLAPEVNQEKNKVDALFVQNRVQKPTFFYQAIYLVIRDKARWWSQDASCVYECYRTSNVLYDIQIWIILYPCIHMKYDRWVILKLYYIDKYNFQTFMITGKQKIYNISHTDLINESFSWFHSK